MREPTPSGEGPHRLNHPWGPMWRIEVQSPRGSRQRDFIHFITVDRADATPPPAHRIVGTGLRGADGRSAGQRAVVVFTDPTYIGEMSVTLGGRPDVVVVLGLEPGRTYDAAVDLHADCTLRLRPSGAAAASPRQ